MIGLETIAALIANHGLLVVAPIAVVEGPIVTVIAAWLASAGLMSLWGLALVVIGADIVGDFGLYALGRWGLGRLPARWLARVGLRQDRLLGLAGHFEIHGGRTLLIGKVTHSAGFLVLVAAGVAKMEVWRFFWFNLLGTVPKSLFFVSLGYAFGAAYAQIDGWIYRASLILLGLIIALGTSVLIRRALRD